MRSIEEPRKLGVAATHGRASSSVNGPAEDDREGNIAMIRRARLLALLIAAALGLGAQPAAAASGDPAAQIAAWDTQQSAVDPPAGTTANPQPALTSAEDWAARIDRAWGAGAPTDVKLKIFDAFWTTIDERFAAFHDLDVDWTALRDRYRPEIAAGVSRGRFDAIMSHLALALRELHTVAGDVGVVGTPRKPGVPIMVLRGPDINNTFGACATAQGDGSALIYNVAPGHPLGLKPGDRILGYDGHPWPELAQELLAAELPLAGSWGSSPSSFEHSLTQSANVNWHLFNTIDILRHDTGTVEHISTASLNTTPPLRSPLCSEQLAVPGVPKPATLSDLVTWGTIDGTRIGYIYVTAWTGDAGDRFAQAVQELTQDPQNPTDGLIIDFRFNRGGSMWLSNAGLGMLFDHPTPTIGFAERADPTDHFKMRMAVADPPSLYTVDLCNGAIATVVKCQPFGHDRASYDRPIAVLTGPDAGSSGDQVALRMTYLPQARIFGESTNGAFNAPCPLNLDNTIDPDRQWRIQYACADAYQIGAPHTYLTHHDLPIDQPVWLTPDDVAQGKDTVVDAAVRWINSQMP